MSADLHLIQYRMLGERRTTILCPVHRRALLSLLRAAGIGSGATNAPSLMSCDRCDSERVGGAS